MGWLFKIPKRSRQQTFDYEKDVKKSRSEF